MSTEALYQPTEPKSEFQQALKDTVPVAMGYLPLAAAYGLLLVQAGVDWYWPAIMSLFVFAGALQFLSVNFIAFGVPVWEVALTTLIVNFRHVFYGFSFPIDKIHNPFIKSYGVFALTDETYSLLAGKDKASLSEKYVFSVQLLSHGYWILGSLFGALASQYIPELKGLDFALTALFVVMAQEHAYRKEMRPYMLLGGIASVTAILTMPSQFLSIAMGVLLVFLFTTFKLKRDV